MVGGFPIPEVNRLMHAFMAGASEVNPDAKFTVSFIGSWYDPPKAKESAFAMIDQGADMLYAERFGVSDAAKERGVKAIGNVIDTQEQYPGTVVASALVAHGALDREGAGRGPGRHLHGRGLRPLEQPRRRRLHGGAAQRRAGAQRGGRAWSRPARPRSAPARARSRSTTASPSRASDARRAARQRRRSSCAWRASPSASAPLLANDAIDLELRRGETLALLGENGAGKTTLMSILFGHYVADAGRVLVADAAGGLRPLAAGSPHAALAAGVGMVHQHFALAANLSVLDNVMLGTEPLWRWRRHRRAARRKLEGLIADAGLEVPLDAAVGGLSIGERQRVEILKALYRDVRVLILDEPTAVLTPQEAEGLFATLAGLAANGPGGPVHQPQARRGDAAVPARRRAARRAQGGGVPGPGHQPRRHRRGHGRPAGQPAAARRAAAGRPRPGAARCRRARPRRDAAWPASASPSMPTRSSASPASRATASGRWPACSPV